MIEPPAFLGQVPLALGQSVSVPRRRFLTRRFFWPYPYSYPQYVAPPPTELVCRRNPPEQEGGEETFTCQERAVTYPVMNAPLFY